MTQACFTTTFHPDELARIKAKMLNWLQPFSIFVYLDNNQYANDPNRYEVLLAAGMKKYFGDQPPEYLPRWLFGHLSYDMKNQMEPLLNSRHPECIGFSDGFWFEPEVVMYIPHNSCRLHIEGERAQDIAAALKQANEHFSAAAQKPVRWELRFSEQEYLDTVQKIQQHITEGDCYELNLCVEAYCEHIDIQPVNVFQRLNTINPSPYASLYRNGDAWLMGASPERFLLKSGNQIFAQPIKGTIGRGKNGEEDDLRKQQLSASHKDRAENIMIVDLMRNDLARSCVPGSIQATELFGIYDFPQVFQMISTVEGQLLPDMNATQILQNSFPMGSMTGAPKVKVMQLIEQYERSRRGIYSGTIGYINPDGDFDFNVVIRSLMYNQRNRYLSYQTGGAITYDSIPEQEWAEIKLKGKAMEAVFS